MTQSSLNTAKFLLKRRKYSKAITLLESNQELYLEDFDYYLTLGTACLYAGDIGNAYNFYQHAREIRLSNANLMLGQAAIFLRRGNTDRALQYYLDILNFEPGNKVARNAMEFIRKHGDYNTIYKWVDNGKIKRFYPPIGLNPDIIRNILFAFFIAGTVISTVFFYNPKEKKNVQIVSRDNPSNIEISGEESGELLATDLSSSVVRYFMDEKQISKSLESAMDYYQSYDDNASQVEINRILNSNASATVKQKASRLMDYTKAPTFDSFDSQKEKHYTNYAYTEVIKDPFLYKDVYVVWNGRISNIVDYDNGGWSFDLLVGYENFKRLDGVVNVRFDEKPYPEADVEKGVSVLGKIALDGNELYLKGTLLYQPLSGKFPQ